MGQKHSLGPPCVCTQVCAGEIEGGDAGIERLRREGEAWVKQGFSDPEGDSLLRGVPSGVHGMAGLMPPQALRYMIERFIDTHARNSPERRTPPPHSVARAAGEVSRGL